jgi:hypothetical protein
MTANQLPVDQPSDAPDPTVDRAVPEADLRGRALGRLRKKTDFRMHVMIYLLVNGMLVVIWAMTGAAFFWPIFPIAGWGIGVVANAVDVYVLHDPTEQQIVDEMERLRRR